MWFWLPPEHAKNKERTVLPLAHDSTGWEKKKSSSHGRKGMERGNTNIPERVGKGPRDCDLRSNILGCVVGVITGPTAYGPISESRVLAGTERDEWGMREWKWFSFGDNALICCCGWCRQLVGLKRAAAAKEGEGGTNGGAGTRE